MGEIDRLYEGMNVRGATELTIAQTSALTALGALVSPSNFCSWYPEYFDSK